MPRLQVSSGPEVFEPSEDFYPDHLLDRKGWFKKDKLYLSNPGLVHMAPWCTTQQLVLREQVFIYKIPTLAGREGRVLEALLLGTLFSHETWHFPYSLPGYELKACSKSEAPHIFICS